MLTVFFILALAAFIVTILSAVNWPPGWPLWVAVLLITIIELLRSLPLGR